MINSSIKATIAFCLATCPLPLFAESIAFSELARTCAPSVHENTMQALVRTESNFNPLAIAVVEETIEQPSSLMEAVSTAEELVAKGKNISLGLGQINIHNLSAYGLDLESVFDPCKNLNASSAILTDCYNRATGNEQQALQYALSCYYSGNFKTGFTQDLKGLPTYVDRVKAASLQNTDEATVKIPALDPSVPAPVQLTTTQVKVKTVAKTTSTTKHKSTTLTDEPIISKSPKTWDAFGDWNR